MNFSTCTSKGYLLGVGRVEEIVAFISIFCCWIWKCAWYSAMCLLNSEKNKPGLYLSFYLSPPCRHLIHIPQRRIKEFWFVDLGRGLVIVGGEWEIFRYRKDLTAYWGHRMGIGVLLIKRNLIKRNLEKASTWSANNQPCDHCASYTPTKGSQSPLILSNKDRLAPEWGCAGTFCFSWRNFFPRRL